MKTPTVSFMVCVIMAVAGSPLFIGVARAVEPSVADPPPGACRAAIDRLETALNAARASRHVVVSAPESLGARLHHQPTPDSVARAQSEAVQRIEDSIATARKLRTEGKRAECIGTLEKVASPIGVR